jgi:hypothetical protein
MSAGAASTLLLTVLGLADEPSSPSHPLVMIAEPAAIDDPTLDALRRIQGETVAAGYDVAIVRVHGDDLRTALETAAPGLKPVAGLGLEWRDRDRAQIWIANRRAGATNVHIVDLESTPAGRAAAVIAVRAVELLQAVLADEDEVARPAGKVPAVVAQAVDGEDPRTARVSVVDGSDVLGPLALAAGVTATANVAGGGVWTPMLAVSHGLGRREPDRFVGRLQLAGLGTQLHATNSSGAATVRHAFGTVDLLGTTALGRRIRLYLSAGAGLLLLTGHGETTSAVLEGRTGTTASALLAYGAGALVALTGGAGLALEVRAAYALPRPLVSIADASVSMWGSPSAMFSATVVLAPMRLSF